MPWSSPIRLANILSIFRVAKLSILLISSHLLNDHMDLKLEVSKRGAPTAVHPLVVLPLPPSAGQESPIIIIMDAKLNKKSEKLS